MRTNRALVRAVKNRQHESTTHPIFGELLNRAARDITRTEEKLAIKAVYLARKMTELVQQINENEERPHFNNLGELQSHGPELNRLCGVLDVVYNNFDRLYAAWNYAVLHEPDRPGREE